MLLKSANSIINFGIHFPQLDDQRNRTPLFVACVYGKTDIALLLVEKGAILNTHGENFDTPLHIAVREGHKRIAKGIIEKADKLQEVGKIMIIIV